MPKITITDEAIRAATWKLHEFAIRNSGQAMGLEPEDINMWVADAWDEWATNKTGPTAQYEPVRKIHAERAKSMLEAALPLLEIKE